MERTPDNSSSDRPSFDDIVENFEVSPPDRSIEAQRELLEAVQGRHDYARQEAGITLVAIDQIPMEAIGPNLDISLRRFKPSTDSEEMFLRINYPDQLGAQGHIITKNIFISLATRRAGEDAVPGEGFDADQASLVFEQADELKRLQASYIPNLSADLTHVFDLRTAMQLAPKQSETKD